MTRRRQRKIPTAETKVTVDSDVKLTRVNTTKDDTL